MLQKLSIRNYALIDELDIEFGQGFTIITGETGAGKSILLGALQLILGERADTGVLSDPAKKCFVEGVFLTDSFDLNSFFEKFDLDEDSTCTIRREINISGKSRAFINDTPVNLSQIRELAAMLVDIHSQHDNLLLESSGFQTQILDAVSRNIELFKEYQKKYKQWSLLNKELLSLKDAAAKSAAERDYLHFQYQELEEMKLKESESTLLDDEFQRLNHASEIIRMVGNAEEILDSEQHSILNHIRQLIQLLAPVGKFIRKGEELVNRIQAVQIELKDILAELTLLKESSEADPHRLDELTERIDRINHLLGKHRVNSSDDLIAIHAQLSERLSSDEKQYDLITIKEQEAKIAHVEVLKLAQQLSAKRVSATTEIQQITLKLLAELGMEKARIEFRLIPNDSLSESGAELVKIYFAANPGTELREIQKVASGGELSRLMLVLKKMTAQSVALPSIVFDEIDTGVSGALADAMGVMLQKMSKNMQVIAITHLPQIASKAEYHLKVAKTTVSNKTITKVERLTKKERIAEIAGMLSGKQLSEEAISNAETLLGIRKK